MEYADFAEPRKRESGDRRRWRRTDPGKLWHLCRRAVHTLRKLLGVDEGEYPIFGDFNHRVLKTACKQIKAKTDLEVIPHFSRGAHGKVHSIKFEIKEQECPLLLRPAEKPAKVKKNKKESSYDKFSNNEISDLIHQLPMTAAGQKTRAELRSIEKERERSL
jgi:plasmid replication initiation protein